jgi:alkyl hydroperoxide reductase subunit AhpF
MAIIADRDRETITQMFDENLDEPVRLVYFTTPKSLIYVPGRLECETCDDVQKLMEEIASFSDKLSLEVHNLQQEREEAARYGVDRVPVLVLEGKAKGRLRFLGAPTGYEFSTLIQDIQLVSKGETALADETKQALEEITDPIHIRVFVTPT